MTERLRERAIVDSIGALIRRKDWSTISAQWHSALDADERWFVAAALRQFRAHDLPEDFNFEFEVLRLESALRLGISSLVEIHLRALLRLRQPDSDQQTVIDGLIIRVLESPATSPSFRAQLRVTHAGRHGTPSAAAEALMNCGRISLNQGHLGRAEAAFLQAIPLYEQLADVRSQAEALHQVGVAQRLLNKHESALSSFQQAFSLGEPMQQAAALLGMADVYGTWGAFEQAQANLHDAWSIYDDLSHNFGKADVLLGMAQLNLLSGNTAEAQQYLHDLRTFVSASSDADIQESFSVQVLDALEARLSPAA